MAGDEIHGKLPAPSSKTKLTFAQIDQQKRQLQNQVVLIEISKVLGEGKDMGNGMLRYIVKDTSGSATPYGQMLFSAQAVEKLGLRASGPKSPFSVYAQIYLPEPKAAVICTALGTRVSGEGTDHVTYQW